MAIGQLEISPISSPGEGLGATGNFCCEQRNSPCSGQAQTEEQLRGLDELGKIQLDFPKSIKPALYPVLGSRRWVEGLAGALPITVLSFGFEFLRRAGPAKLGIVRFPFAIRRKHISCHFSPCPAAGTAGTMGLFLRLHPQPSTGIPGRAEPRGRPGAAENARALHVCRFHVRWFPRKPLALHVCRLTPYLLSFG